jgi:hypothetical protein
MFNQLSKGGIMNKSWLKYFWVVILVSAFLVSETGFAQLETPRVSPFAKVKQRIGLTDITIVYHRPAAKGREIWGKLVPYGMSPGVSFGSGNPFPWRAGANENTVINLTDDVKIEGKVLPAGKYGLHMIPTEKDWTIIFSKNYSSWGSFHYDESEDALRVTVTPVKAEHKEWLEYSFEDLTNSSAIAYLHWEKMKVPFKIEVNTTDIVMHSYEDQLRGQLGFNWQNWNQAAFYCLQNNVNLDRGLEFINKSISMNENATNRNMLAYLFMAKGNNEEAMKVFLSNTKKYPENWNVWDSLGEAYANSGDSKNAKKYYKKAHDMAPDNQKSRIEDILTKLEENKTAM